MAERLPNGHFAKGNKLAKGNNTPYIPRTSSGHFKQTVNDILDKIPVEDVLDKLYELDSDKFVYIYTEFMKLQQSKDNAELKHELEKIKLDREQSGDYDDNKTINITFIDADADADED
jgi:hypothetical protein